MSVYTLLDAVEVALSFDVIKSLVRQKNLQGRQQSLVFDSDLIVVLVKNVGDLVQAESYGNEFQAETY